MSQDEELKQYKQKMINELNDLMNNTDEISEELSNLRSSGMIIDEERLFEVRMEVINSVTYEDIQKTINVLDGVIDKAKVIKPWITSLQANHNESTKNDEIDAMVDKYIEEAIKECPMIRTLWSPQI